MTGLKWRSRFYHARRDSPTGIPEGDITDIYAFLDPQNRGRLILIMGVNPLSVPGFTHSYRFAKEYLYQFKSRDSENRCGRA